MAGQRLERYNLIFYEGGNLEGLCILKTEKYVSLLTENPGMPHDNGGDFYSDVPCEELADKIYQALTDFDKRSVEDTIITEADSFDPITCDQTKEYIVRENDGVRIYSATFSEEEYKVLPLFFLEKLFSPSQEGSLQYQFKELLEELGTMAHPLNEKELDKIKQGMKKKLN